MAAAEKGGYPHFMLKEIYDQPRWPASCCGSWTARPMCRSTPRPFARANPLFLVGCGTSYHACLLGAYYMNKLAGKVAIPLLPQQFVEQYGNSLTPAAAVVFVSQSGETKDVLNAVNRPRQGVPALGLVNVIGSTLTHVTDLYLPLACGYEISVPATKTFLNQAILFRYLAGVGVDAPSLAGLPALLEQTLDQVSAAAERVAQRLIAWDELYYLGYGVTHPIALEGALKLKEITYAHCEGIFSSEFKHGPLSSVRRAIR